MDFKIGPYMTNDVTEFSQNASREVQHVGFDLLSPMTSRALFWRARYVADSPALQHIPLIFWVTEALRPNVVVTLGIRDAVPYFAACQAVEKLGLDSLCYGVDAEDEENAADLDGIRAFNEHNFSDFSHIMRGESEADASFLHGAEIDLLIVHRDASHALFDTLDSTWLKHLSERGVILFTRGGTTAYDYYIRRLSQRREPFIFDMETRASVVLRGDRHPDRLQRLASLKLGDSSYLSARTVFARLGELHAKSHQVAIQEKEQNGLVAVAQTEALDLKQQVQELTEHLAAESKKAAYAADQCAALQAELDAANQKVESGKSEYASLTKEAETRQHELEEAHDKINSLNREVENVRSEIEVARAEGAEAEKSRCELRFAEYEEELNQRYIDIATLGNEIQKKEKEIEGLEASEKENSNLRAEVKTLKELMREKNIALETRNTQIKDLEASLSKAREANAENAARVAALEESTSWRVTAPLRKVTSTLKRR